MKPTYFVSAAVSALMLSVVAVSAQTAPATPAQTAPAATPAPATTGIPAAFVNDPVVTQIQTQLSAQGYTITNVVKDAAGVYTVDAVSAAGATRQVTYDPATGTTMDTVAAGAGAMATGMPNDSDDGAEGADDNGSDDNGRDDNGSDNGDSHDNGSDDNGSDDNGSDNESGSDD